MVLSIFSLRKYRDRKYLNGFTRRISKLVKSILANNCFPTKLVNKHINIRTNELNSRHCTGLTQKTISDIKNFIALPYFNKISDNISRKLSEQGFRTFFTVPKKLDRFIKTGKDTLQKKMTHVVYKIDCGNCNLSYNRTNQTTLGD